MSRRSALVVYFMLVLGLFHGTTEAGPVKRPSRMAREVYPEIEPENEGNQAQVCIVGDVVYGMDETVPAEQPCLKCKCQAPGVQCETIQCVKRPGCKAVHKPNKCCPDYQCECEHNGKFYANGEKLETSAGGECKVCYCRGGEVQCAEVSCYIRRDCEGKRVPGTCCPRYDHCPPIDPTPSRYTTEIIIPNPNKEDVEPWPQVVTNFTESSFYPSSSSSASSSSFSSESTDFQDENKIPDTNYLESSTSPGPPGDGFQNDAAAAVPPSITIQEIVPERKEIPVTSSPTRLDDQEHLIFEERRDSDADSSEASEVYRRPPPPVLRVGDKLLFLDKGGEGGFVREGGEASTPSSVITVVGAEGLQRGGFEESGEVHEVRISTVETTPDADLEQELLLNTAASTHVLSLVKRKDHATTTMLPTETTSQSEETTATTLVVDDHQVTTSTTDNPLVVNLTDDASIPEQNPAYPPISEILVHQDVDDASQRFEVDEQVDPTDKNLPQNASNDERLKHTVDNFTGDPEKSRQDIVSTVEVSLEGLTTETVLQVMSKSDWLKKTNKDFLGDPEESKHDVIPTAKILPEVLSIRSNKTVPQNVTNSDWLKQTDEDVLEESKLVPELPRNISVELLRDSEISNNKTASNTEWLKGNDDAFISLGGELLGDPGESTSTTDRSVEEVDSSAEESGENTTPKGKSAAIVSAEDASVESARPSSEANDMVEDIAEESATPIIDHLVVDETKKNDSGTVDDVEIIDTTRFHKPRVMISTTDIPEPLPQPEKLVIKREVSSSSSSSSDDDDEEASPDDATEDDGSDAVFKELLEDSSTPRSASAEKLDAVGNALARFAFRGAPPDPGVLGLLSSFLGRSEG